MGRKPTGNPNGRPRIEINQKQFENLCAIHCTKDEIASVLDCSPDTIEKWCKHTYGDTFTATYKKYQGIGKMSLRRMQFKMAERSASMAIFLGKQYLGQTDKIEQTVTEVEDLSPLAEMLRDDVACQATDCDSETQE